MLPEQPKKCTEKRKNNTTTERGMIPLSDRDVFSKPNDPINNEVDKQLAFITSTDAVKVSPEVLSYFWMLYKGQQKHQL